MSLVKLLKIKAKEKILKLAKEEETLYIKGNKHKHCHWLLIRNNVNQKTRIKILQYWKKSHLEFYIPQKYPPKIKVKQNHFQITSSCLFSGKQLREFTIRDLNHKKCQRKCFSLKADDTRWKLITTRENSIMVNTGVILKTALFLLNVFIKYLTQHASALPTHVSSGIYLCS